MNAPPIGVMPLRLWREVHPEPTESARLNRRVEVAQAITRYCAAGLPVPSAWLDELREVAP